MVPETVPEPAEARTEQTLRHHREALAKNPQAYTADLARAATTLIPHLKACGFSRATPRRCGAVAAELVAVIFDAQDARPFFHVDGALPYCWNRPADWDRPYIRYEWGHLHSRNQSQGAAPQLTDLCLQSARCNQHIQTSMDIEEVLEWLRGSRVDERVRRVLAQREAAFRGERWRRAVAALERLA